MYRRVTVASAVGLHARPASLLANAARARQHPVTVAKVVDGAAAEPVDAASVLAVMGLGVGHGEEVELSCDDPASLDELVELLERDLDGEAA